MTGCSCQVPAAWNLGSHLICTSPFLKWFLRPLSQSIQKEGNGTWQINAYRNSFYAVTHLLPIFSYERVRVELMVMLLPLDGSGLSQRGVWGLHCSCWCMSSYQCTSQPCFLSAENLTNAAQCKHEDILTSLSCKGEYNELVLFFSSDCALCKLFSEP